MTSCLAIITARGGSKRIKRKNIKYFLGQPIIKYSIDAIKKIMAPIKHKIIQRFNLSPGKNQKKGFIFSFFKSI